MSYNFKNLADVELLEGVPEHAYAFVEVDGMIKRAPGTGLGGENGIKTVIIKDNYYDDVLSGNSQAPMAVVGGPSNEFTTSMTFDEVMEILASGEPLQIYVLGQDSSYTVFQGIGNYSFSLSTIPRSSSGSMAKIVISIRYYSDFDGYYKQPTIIWTNEEIYYRPLDD